MTDPLKNILLGIAPEREEKLMEIWSIYEPEIYLADDTNDQDQASFVMEGGLFKFVRFNHRTMRLFWIAAFIVVEGQRQIERIAAGDNNCDFSRFEELLGYFNFVMSSGDYLAVTVPEGVTQPGTYINDGDDCDKKLAEQLATFSAGWALLHEIKHIQHQRDGTGAPQNATPSELHKEEFSCDEYATKFILQKAGIYAASMQLPTEMVLAKRHLGILTAYFTLYLISASQGQASKTHPSIEDRMKKALSYMGNNLSDETQAFMIAAFMALQEKFDFSIPFECFSAVDRSC